MKKLFFKNFNNQNKGFTLVETLVALSIFTVSILSLLVILGGSISNTGYAKRKIIASYLAEEGVEYIRNMRDTFVLYDVINVDNGWNEFNSKLLSNSCQINDGGCYVDDQGIDYGNQSQPMASVTLASCGTACPGLLYNSTTGKYNYASGTNSGYFRKITMIQISATETKVISTVYWLQGSGVKSISFSDNLFSWIE